MNQNGLIDAYEEMRELNIRYFHKMKLSFNGEMRKTSGVAREEYMQLTENSPDKRILHLAATNVHLTRMFSGLGMGRMIQRSRSYQNVKKVYRSDIKINGEKTVELDYSSMHVNIAYFMMGQRNPHLHDSYSPIVEHLGIRRADEGELACVREVVKRCVLVAFNTPDKKGFEQAMRYNYPEHHGTLTTSGGISFGQVYDAFLHVHPGVKKTFMNLPHKADVFMFHESQNMMCAMRALQEHKINALPLHDGIIADARHAQTVRTLMVEQYRKYTGNDILVK